MRKFIYQSIEEKLQSEMPEIKHFDLWHNQLEYIEGEIPFELPAVLVEFRPVKWRHQSNGVRDADIEIALHVLNQNIPASADFFDLLTDINRVLLKHSKSGDRFSHGAITSVQSTTDNNFDEIRHDIEVFACYAADGSAMPKMQKVNPAG